MSVRYILGQLQITSFIGATDPYTVLYEVPEPAIGEVGPGGSEVEFSPKAQSQLVQTLVTGITICNFNDSVTTNVQYILMRLTPGGGTEPDDSHYLHLIDDLAVGTTWIINHGLVLGPGDRISVTAWGGLGGVVRSHFTLFGVETTSYTGPS